AVGEVRGAGDQRRVGVQRVEPTLDLGVAALLQLVEARCGLRAGHTGGERDGDDGAGGHGEETLHFVRSPSWVASPLSTLPTSPSSACSCESIDVRSDCTVGSSVDGAEDEAVLAAVAVDDDAAGVAEWLLPP